MFKKIKYFLCISLCVVSILAMTTNKAQAEAYTNIQATAMMVKAATLGDVYLKPIWEKVKKIRAQKTEKVHHGITSVTYRHEDGVQVGCGIRKCAVVFE